MNINRVTVKERKGKYRWSLKASNGKTLARSTWYCCRETMLNNIENVIDIIQAGEFRLAPKARRGL